MKFLILILSLVVSGTVFADKGPVLVDSKFSKSYVPIGFDSNDQVQFVAEGVFSNGCYRKGPVAITVNQETKQIKLSPQSYMYLGACIQVLVKYSKVIDVGVLSPGTYSIVQGKDNDVIGTLPVKPNTVEGADDFLYAPINQAMLTRNGEDVTLILTGTFTNSCLSLGDVIVTPQEDVVVVQPTVKISGSAECVNGSFHFKYEKVIEEEISQGRYLLHVRSMNGKAVNNLVEL
ncbi:MAG: hypothetical protein ACRBBP_08975 [Bdellovibrionales bacterium]